MGKRTSHPPGTFSWVDLATTDAEAAKAFYTGLFGWQTEEGDAGGGATYTTCRLGGDAVCGIFETSADAGAAGAPPAWTSHVTVADADAAASRAKELGGRLVSGPATSSTRAAWQSSRIPREPSSRSGSHSRGSALSASTTSATSA